MRVLKFRGWHKEDKVMVNDLNSLRLYHGTLIPEDYILMQFTGLVDNKEKEIYEGDILKWSTGYIDSVEYDERGFWIDWDFLESGEIIGNIYENPEFMENK